MKICIIISVFLYSWFSVAQTTSEYQVSKFIGNTADAEMVIGTYNDEIFILKSDKNYNIFTNSTLSLTQATLTGNEWNKSKTLRSNVTGFSRSKDGKKVIFSQIENGKHQLYKAQIKGNKDWTDIVKLPFSMSEYNYKQPCLNQSQDKLFFVSDQKDSYGGTDIYYVSVNSDLTSFGNVVHLNYYVNSPKDEIFPIVYNDEKLYFSSNGMNGLGGFDLYSIDIVNEKFENISNLGEPINSVYDDFGFIPNHTSSSGFLSSNRTGSIGNYDIFKFEIKNNLTSGSCNSLKGFVKTKGSQKPVSEAIIDIFDKNGNNQTILSDTNGYFEVADLTCDMLYELVCYKEGYNGFFEVHSSPSKNEMLILWLNPEFPEGYKEEFDVKNEVVIIDTKTKKEIIPEKPTVQQQINNAKLQQDIKKQDHQIATSKKTPYYDESDPLDYDPHSTPKKTKTVTSDVQNKQTPEVSQKKVTKIKDDYDPLDYDPHTQQKPTSKHDENENVVTNTTKEKNLQIEAERQKRIGEAQAYVEELKQKETQNHIDKSQNPKTDSPTAAEIRRKQIEVERQQRIAEAKKYAEELQQKETQKVAISEQEMAKINGSVVKNKENNIIANADKTNNKISTNNSENNIAKTNETQNSITPKTLVQEAPVAPKTVADKAIQQETERQLKLAEAKKYAEELQQKETQKVVANKQEIAKTNGAVDKNKENNTVAKAEADKTNVNIATNSSEKKIASANETQNGITPKTVAQETPVATKTVADNVLTQEAERQHKLAEAKKYAEELKKAEQHNIKEKDVVFKNNKKAESENQIKAIEVDTPVKFTTDREQRIKDAEKYAEKIKQAEIAQNQSDNNLTTILKSNFQDKDSNSKTKVDEKLNEERCSKSLKGFVGDAHSKKPLNNVKVDMYFEGQNIESVYTDTEGLFNFVNIDCNENFTLICYKDGLNNMAKTSFNTFSNPEYQTIYIEPNLNHLVAHKLPVRESVTLSQKQNTTISDISHNQPNESNTPKNNIVQKTLDEDVVIHSRNIETPEIKEGKIVLNPIYFELDEYYLTLDARRELDKIIKLMTENPTIIIESGSHTDTRGEFEYNLILSEKRSQEAVGYLIANGVDSDRISGRGYGETMPVNHCLDGVKCSEAEHLKNRRTEFVVLKY